MEANLPSSVARGKLVEPVLDLIVYVSREKDHSASLCVFCGYGAVKYLKVDEYLDQEAQKNVLNMLAMLKHNLLI